MQAHAFISIHIKENHCLYTEGTAQIHPPGSSYLAVIAEGTAHTSRNVAAGTAPEHYLRALNWEEVCITMACEPSQDQAQVNRFSKGG